MLLHTLSHLLPRSDGSPPVKSSPTTSSYIPDIPYDDFSRPPHMPHPPSSRRDRRMRSAPYPLVISTNPAPPQSHQRYQKVLPNGHDIPLHSPRPVAYFNPAQAFDNVSCNASVHSPLAFTPGAHGTILAPFSMQSESTSITSAALGELTATQMACMSIPPRDVPSPYAVAYAQSSQSHNAGPHFVQIQVPQVPSIPRIASEHPPLSRPLDLSAPNGPNGAPHLPDAIPPEKSQLHIKPSAALAPPCDTFPTPVELLNELSLLDAEVVQRDRRRAERRKALLTHEAEALGFSPTDPDTISTHDKKRLYLDCLEQYVVYLHNQLRLAGYEPVPVERVSSGRGLTSRSIRTMIVHLRSTTANLHAQKREAEVKYDELRAQLGADADLTAPTLAGTTVSGGINAGTRETGMQQPSATARAGLIAAASTSGNGNVCDAKTRYYCNRIGNGTGAGADADADVQAAY